MPFRYEEKMPIEEHKLFYTAANLNTYDAFNEAYPCSYSTSGSIETIVGYENVMVKPATHEQGIMNLTGK